MKNKPLPLSGYKILDLTRVRSGPTAVRQFADWGADVVKVEPPPAPSGETEMGGLRYGPDFQNLHRNKRSISLNLKSEEGRRILFKLAEDADVLVENFRPAVKYRLGIDYERVTRINPRLVYVSISGFGQDGPYADRPGYDQIIQGMSGMMSVTGEPGRRPMRAGIAIADTATGLYAAIAILTALLERERTGKGQWMQISLLESMLAVLDFQAARWLVAGEVPARVGNDHPTIIPTGTFETADGEINICVSGDVMWKRLCKTLNVEHWLNDPRFSTNRNRSEHRTVLNNGLAVIFKAQTSAYWIDELNAAGLACGPINTLDKAFADPQVDHMGVAWRGKHPKLGDIGLVGQPFRSNEHRPGIRSYAPDVGQHTEEILLAVGYSMKQIESLRQDHVI